ncbi:MAG: arylesterase [Desulfobulbaceae bacterium]|nr:arylesterase [Desulfobulbaceae bacterium]
MARAVHHEDDNKKGMPEFNAKMNKEKYQTKFLLVCFLIGFLLFPACRQQEEQTQTGQADSVPGYDGTIIAVGDSLTAGLGVALEEAWPALLQEKLLANGFNWQVINAGISGETSSGTLSRIKWILARQPDVVILETGANDGLRGISTSVIKENIDQAVTALQEGGATVVLAGMQIVMNLGAEYTGSFTEIYPQVANERQVILIPFFLQDVAGEPALNQTDTIHPNPKGHEKIAETVFPYILQAIQQNRR